MRTRVTRLALSVFLLATSSALAGAFVHPRSLSGIDLYDGTVEQVIAILGAPSRFTTVPTSKRSYEWDRKTCRLKVIALDDGRIIRIDVWGSTTPGSTLGATRRGLKLSATVGEARRTYARFHLIGFSPEERWKFYLDCAPPRPILVIDFDAAGRIDHMKLTTETVYCY